MVLAQVMAQDLALALVMVLVLVLAQALAQVLILTALLHLRLSLERSVPSLFCIRDNITTPAPQKTLEASPGVPHQLEMTTVLRSGITASLPPLQTQVTLDLLGPVVLDLEEVHPVVLQAQVVTFIIYFPP